MYVNRKDIEVGQNFSLETALNILESEIYNSKNDIRSLNWVKILIKNTFVSSFEFGAKNELPVSGILLNRRSSRVAM